MYDHIETMFHGPLLRTYRLRPEHVSIYVSRSITLLPCCQSPQRAGRRSPDNLRYVQYSKQTFYI